MSTSEAKPLPCPFCGAEMETDILGYVGHVESAGYCILRAYRFPLGEAGSLGRSWNHRAASASVNGADVETNYAALKEQLLNWAKVLRIDPMVTIHGRAANLAFATEIEAMVGKLP